MLFSTYITFYYYMFLFSAIKKQQFYKKSQFYF